MKWSLLHIFSLLFISNLFSQVDSLSSESTENKVRFIEPSITLDYGKIATNFFTDNERFEGALHILFYDFLYFSGEAGKGNLTPVNAYQNADYSSSGNYFRLGGGLLKPINARSKLGFGVCYAKSSFNDIRITYSESVIQESQTSIEKRENLSARWMEMVLTSESLLRINKSNPESRMNELFSIGFNFRLRYLSSYDKDSPIDIYSIPGFGKVINSPVPAVNLYLRLNL